MIKIPCLFKRDYGRDTTVKNEVNEGCQWVLDGEGVAYIKWDGSACAVINGKLYKRYDAKLNKKASRQKKRNPNFVPALSDFKTPPEGAIECQPPDMVTGHWPHWASVTESDKKHTEARGRHGGDFRDGTYELVGNGVQGNKYNLAWTTLVPHTGEASTTHNLPPLDTYDRIKEFMKDFGDEGLVFHHPDGRMAKIRRKDFGYSWPVE